MKQQTNVVVMTTPVVTSLYVVEDKVNDTRTEYEIEGYGSEAARVLLDEFPSAKGYVSTLTSKVSVHHVGFKVDGKFVHPKVSFYNN